MDINMGNKWSIAERPGVYERCRQLEAIAQKIFQSPKAWVNGFIRLVSLEGTWYYHRGTDIFVPVEQEYLEQTFSADGKPEKGVIRLKAGNMGWDYLDDLEAQQILPNLAELNLPKISGKHNVGEICRTAAIFLKGGKVYDGRCKGIRFLQNDEKATVLQICHSENAYSGKVHKEQKNDSWRYDIYLWAETGVVPAVLCNIKECWNTIQFLRDNFNDIDFTDFVLPEGKAEGGAEPETAREAVPAAGKEQKAAEADGPMEPGSREAPAEEPKAAELQEEPQSAEPEASAEPGLREEPQPTEQETLAEAESREETNPEPEESAAEPEVGQEPKSAWWEEPPAEAQPQPEILESPEPKSEPESLEAAEEAAREEEETAAGTQEEAESGNPSAPESTEEWSASNLEEAAEKQDGQESEKQTEQIGRVEKMGIVRGQDEIQQLLDCDKNRCRLEPYDRDILYDIIRGHWELFQEGETYCDDSEQELIPRDPRLDIREGVIGIDFGTKSTVVVRQDATNRIVPIRIGTGNLSSEVKEEDFENPSIIEFTNVKNFLEDYQKEAGRPHTSCNDVFVSYDAYEDFRNCKPEDFYAYFSELKQWANREKGDVVVKDKQKVEYTLGAKMEDGSSVVNPIELYAYYIGLAINNMRNGIYLKYLMTFPVGYAKEIRDFIAESFYEGIKKSLPSSVINDKECMEQFKVELGISEPAAYAVTALEQSGLEPEDETQRRMYGIFDFGGGTTDFDFGICRGATEEEYEEEAYDYVLECFGADSDVTLGGENILELIAYQVYQRNLDVFREKKITFTLPLGEKGFAGSETLLINSQIARRNMAILKEELRPLWHQEQGWRKKYQLDGDSQNEVDKEGIVVSLYNMDGEPVPQCVLEFSSQELVEMLKNRIQKGIDSFFQCLLKVFQDREDVTAEDDTIYIFLAGNASKSVFVKELFQRKIEEYYSKSKKASEGMGNVSFVLIDPLTGGNESGEGYVPNAKTGVAYGLLKSRDGSSIKIVKNHETDALQQSRFHYYLGRDRRHCFDCRFSPAEIAYKKWVPFQKASKSVVRIYYTNNPMADSKMEQLPIEDVPYKEIGINVTEGASLFIRTVEPDMIEYAVAKDAEDISENEIKKCLFD